MDPFHLALLAAALLCSLVAGFLFAFAAVVMPGLRRLPTPDSLRAFRAMDGVIQAGSPLFLGVWAGSVLALLAAAGLALAQPAGPPRTCALVAAAVYLLGVQLPTAAIHLPLNRRLQDVEPGELEPEAQAALRAAFEGRWTRANAARTLLACAAAGLLLVALRGL